MVDGERASLWYRSPLRRSLAECARHGAPGPEIRFEATVGITDVLWHTRLVGNAVDHLPWDLIRNNS